MGRFQELKERFGTSGKIAKAPAPRDDAGNIKQIEPPPTPEEYIRCKKRAVDFIVNTIEPTHEGNRDNTLANTVCQYLRDEYLNDEDALTLLKWWNDNKCIPPLEEELLATKWSASLYRSRNDPIGVAVARDRQGIGRIVPGMEVIQDVVADREPTPQETQEALARLDMKVHAPDTTPVDHSTGMVAAVIYQDHRRTIDQIEPHFAARVKDTFVQRGKLVRVVPGERGPILQEHNKHALQTDLTGVFKFFKHIKSKDGFELEPTTIPNWLAAEFLAYGKWQNIRMLSGMTSLPRIRSDGTIMTQPGYDADGKLLYLPPNELKDLKIGETRAEAEAARDVLLDMIQDFPFASHEHRAAMLAAILTPFCRVAINGPVPLMLIEANKRNVGKSLLMKSAGAVFAPGECMNTKWDNSQNGQYQNVQTITTAFRAGKYIIFLDNISGRLGDPLLDRLLTLAYWDERLLGGNEMISADNVLTLMVTGNNLSLMADVQRRTLPIRLIDKNIKHPTERAHDDILAFVVNNRRILVEACLTVLSAFFQAGKPALSHSLESFESWSQWVASALMWLGLPDATQLVESGDTEDDDSTDRVERDALFHALLKIMNLNEASSLTAQEIAEAINKQTISGSLASPFGEFPGLLRRKMKHANDMVTRDTIGYVLRRHRDNVSNGKRLVSMKGSGRNNPLRWTLVDDEGRDPHLNIMKNPKEVQ